VSLVFDISKNNKYLHFNFNLVVPMCSVVIFGKTKYLAQNYDFNLDHGLVSVNLKGKRKSNGEPSADKAVEWIAKFGSITFNQFSLELPVSGMNEAGLVASLLWHEEGVYGHGENIRRLSSLQWIQYQLDNFQTIQEVVESLMSIHPEQGPIPLHFSVLDANGNSVFIEFLDGELQLHQNTNSPVLTNTSYSDCIDGVALPDSIPEHSNINSRARFNHLYKQLDKLDNATVKDGFKLLESVSQSPKNGSRFPWNSNTDSDTVTAWSIVFNPADKVIFLRSHQNQAIRQILFSDFHFEPDKDGLIMDVNAGVEGPSFPFFTEYSKEKNETILQLSAQNMGLPDSMVSAIADEVHQIHCQ